MVLVAGCLLLRWLHQNLWWGTEPTPAPAGDGGGRGGEFDLLLARPSKLRRPKQRPGLSEEVCLQNAENELRRRRREDRERANVREKLDQEDERRVVEERREKEVKRLVAEVASLEAVVELKCEEVRSLRRRLEGRERREEEEVRKMWERVSRVAVEGSSREATSQTEREEGEEKEDFEKTDEEKHSQNKERHVDSKEGTRVCRESGYFTQSDDDATSPLCSRGTTPVQEVLGVQEVLKVEEWNEAEDVQQVHEDKKGLQEVKDAHGQSEEISCEKPKKLHYERRPSRFIL